MNPLQVPQRGPYEERYSSKGHLHISKRPNKNSSNKKAPRNKCPSMFSKSGGPMEIGEILRLQIHVNIFIAERHQ